MSLMLDNGPRLMNYLILIRQISIRTTALDCKIVRWHSLPAECAHVAGPDWSLVL